MNWSIEKNTTAQRVSAYLELHFAGGELAELECTRFSHPALGTVQHTVRGKTAGVHNSAGTFQWSPAVRALCGLLLRSVASSHADAQGMSCAAIIKGYRSSPASSLDYALAKQPLWLLEMFGQDSHGRGLARRLVHRSNPEMRRPGPVSVSLNSSFMSPTNILVFVDGERCSSAEALSLLADRILHETNVGNSLPAAIVRTPRSKAPNGESCQSSQDLQPQLKSTPASLAALRRIYEAEVRRNLRTVDIFHQRAISQLLGALQRQTADSTFFPEAGILDCTVDRSLRGAARHGIINDPQAIASSFPDDAPLDVSIVAIQASTASLLTYLRNVRGLSINLHYTFAHSTDIAQAIEGGSWEPDAAVLNCATAAYFLHRAKGRYMPLMVMPGITHRVLGGQGARLNESRMPRGRFHFMHQIPTTASLYFHTLKMLKRMPNRGVSVEETEPCDATALLQDAADEAYAVLPFPHYVFCERFNGCKVLDRPEEQFHSNFGVLIVHERLFQDKERARTLDILIRDAWLTLREREDILSATLADLLDDEQYVTFLARTCGLHNLL